MSPSLTAERPRSCICGYALRGGRWVRVRPDADCPWHSFTLPAPVCHGRFAMSQTARRYVPVSPDPDCPHHPNGGKTDG